NDAGKARRETVPGKDYILLLLWPADLLLSQILKSSPDAGLKPSRDNEKKVTEEPRNEGGDPSNKNDSVNSTNNINTASDRNNTNNVNTVSSTVNTDGLEVNAVSSNTSIELPNDLNIPKLEDIMYSYDYEDVGAEVDINNLNTFMLVSPIPPNKKNDKEFERTWMSFYNSNYKRFGPWWIYQMEKRAIGTKWVFRNKKDERGTVIKNKARLVAQGYTQEKGIN
ncbi:putative ribonuclease H-like domain-containing protein, partial [Tanacetum coccineum]